MFFIFFLLALSLKSFYTIYRNMQQILVFKVNVYMQIIIQ